MIILIIRDIILNKLTGKSIEEYVFAQASKFIKEEEQKFFIEDVMEDLKELDQSRIAGLGITSDQLKAWIADK